MGIGVRDLAERFHGWIGIVMICISAILVPLYMNNGYLDLIEAKAEIYLRFALPAAILSAVLFIFLFFYGTKKKSPERKSDFVPGGSIPLLLLPVIGLWAVISTCLSPDSGSSLMGKTGWSMGSLMIVTLILSTLTAAASFRSGARPETGSEAWSKARPERRSRSVLLLLVMAVNVPVFLFAAAQAAGADPFGLLSRIDASYRYLYLSTIGQINSFSGYLCLLLPLIWGLFINCSGTARLCGYGALSALGFVSVCAAGSDSSFAGFGFCALFMLPFVLCGRKRTSRAAVLVILYGCVLLLFGRLPLFADRASHMTDLSAAVLSLPCAAGILACGLLLLLCCARCPDSFWGKISRPLLLLCEGALLIVIAAAVMYSVRHFDDSWGTNRGLIWRVGWEQFRAFELRRKITGIGPDMLSIVYAPLRVSHRINVVSAHCEPLQVLLTQGIVGLALYCVFWGALAVSFLKGRRWESEEAVLFFPLAAYFGQSLFCSAYPVTAVLFSAAAGLYLGMDAHS